MSKKFVKTLVSTAALCLFTSTFACAARAASIGEPDHAVTRQEVREDLEAWVRAGLAEAWRGDGTPDIYSQDYQRRFAEYERLRAAAVVSRAKR